jgi:hypothetical protein
MLSIKKLIFEAPEANPDDIFGEYIFGGSRRDEPAKNEENTQKENEFSIGLFMHYDRTPYNDMVSKHVPDVLNLIKQGKYLDFLKPDDKHKYAYRLIKDIGEKKAEQMFGIDFKDLLENKKTHGLIKKNFLYHPKENQNKLSSWTVNLDKKIFKNILRFNNRYHKTHNFSITVLLQTKIENNNFFLNPEQIQNKTALEHLKEWEVLSYGDVTVDKFSYFITDYENTSGFGIEVGEFTIYKNDDILNKLIELIK